MYGSEEGSYSNRVSLNSRLPSNKDQEKRIRFNPESLRVQGLEFRVQGLGFRVWGSGFGVEGVGFKV